MGWILIIFEEMIHMKKVFFLLIALASITTLGFGQAKKKGVQTVTIKTPSVQCNSCKERIEKYIIRETGVQKVNVDYKRKVTKVTYVAERTNIENIKTAIANIGYDADDVTANEEFYKKLPLCCKKPEDGGGMKE